MTFNKDLANQLVQQLCELKLEERRLGTDIHHLVKNNNTIDFFKAKSLNGMRSGIKKKIKNVEARIMPNIIA